MKRVFIRSWIVFVILWSVVFGYRYDVANRAYSNAAGEMVMANILNGITHSASAGDAVTSQQEQLADSTRAAKNAAFWLLICGLMGGSLAIGTIYWIASGAQKDPIS